MPFHRVIFFVVFPNFRQHIYIFTNIPPTVDWSMRCHTKSTKVFRKIIFQRVKNYVWASLPDGEPKTIIPKNRFSGFVKNRFLIKIRKKRRTGFSVEKWTRFYFSKKLFLPFLDKEKYVEFFQWILTLYTYKNIHKKKFKKTETFILRIGSQLRFNQNRF